MTCTTVQLQAHDVCNCTIMAEIRPVDDQSDSRILIIIVMIITLMKSRILKETIGIKNQT